MTPRPKRPRPAPKPRIQADPALPLVLAIDTSGPIEAIVLLQGGLVLADQRMRRPRRRGTALGVAIRDLLAAVERAPSNLSAIAVITGPGAFTGLRVGVATAHGLARAVDVPLYSYDATTAHACGVSAGAGQVGVLLDARRDEVYTAVFDERTDGLPGTTRELRLESPESFIEAAADLGPLLLVGDGARLYSGILRAGLPSARIGHLEPTGPGLAAIAQHALRRVESGDPGPIPQVQPLYLRDHDAAKKDPTQS